MLNVLAGAQLTVLMPRRMLRDDGFDRHRPPSGY